jgi:ABC-2 type transport system ATP-binding protein
MITLQNLIKNYGSLRAVDGINFTINEGEILGFLGPNGAGKSTTLKMITCYLTPTDGNILIGELNVFEHSREIRRMIGYLPEHNPLYHEMTVYDYLKFVSEVREIPDTQFKNVLKRVIAKCGLSDVISRPIKELSKGYRQRVGIAAAIIHDPKILILDEPTSGLDPNQIVGIRELIRELGREKTVIISSHILQEVQAVCDRICIINRGQIVGQGTTEELRMSNQRKAKLYLEVIAPESEVTNMSISGVDMMIREVQSIEGSDWQHISLELTYPSEIDYRRDIYNHIKSRDWTLLEMHRHISSLEDIFRNLTGGLNV